MNFLAGHFSDRELSAGDLVREDIYALIAADAKLQAIFGPDHMHTSSLMPAAVGGTLPDLWVTNLLHEAEDRPGWVKGNLSVHVICRFIWPIHEPIMSSGPGLDTFRSYLWHGVLQDRGQILRRQVGGESIPYTQRISPGPTGYGQSAIDPDNLVYRLVLELSVECAIDNATGKPSNLKNAGW